MAYAYIRGRVSQRSGARELRYDRRDLEEASAKEDLFIWLAGEQTFITRLRDDLRRRPILDYPDFTPAVGIFFLDTDVIDGTIGAVLSESQANAIAKFTASASRAPFRRP